MTKFIKEQWLYILLVLSSLCYAVLKLNDGQWADALFALSFMLVALKASFLSTDLNDLREDHEELIADYINELRSSLDFIQGTKTKLFDILDVADEQPQVVKAKRGRPKKAVQPAKGKRGRPKKVKA